MEYKELTFKDYPQFKPNMTPEQVIKHGAFGGTYFRPIFSGVLKKNLKDQHLEFSFLKDVEPGLLTQESYDKKVNYYKVECGTSLELWESKKWIEPIDPYGWFQWYCRFYSGRRSYDDERQIKRWQKITSPRNRFSKKPLSDRVKQMFLHWAWWVS